MLFKNKNEKIVIVVGSILFMIVVVITLFRSKIDRLVEDNTSLIAENSSKTIIDPELPKILPKDLLQKIKNDENVVILDFRSEDEFQIEHIIDAKNIPLAKIPDQKIDEPLDSQIVVVASSAEQAAQGIKMLSDQGFKNVKVLSGGISAWTSANGQTVSWGDPTSFVNQAKVNYISSEDVKKALDEKQNIYILDVRPVGLFSSRIPGAVNIPINMLEKKRKDLPSNREIIVYGQSELEAFHAGVMLYDMNIFPVSVLRGGFTDWTEKNHPIEK